MFPLKPKSPRIDWKNPLTSGLVFDEPFFEGGGKPEANILTDILGTASNITFEDEQFGKALNFTNASSLLSYTTTTPQNSLSAVSVMVVAKILGAGGGNLARLVQKGDTSNYFWVSWYDTSGGTPNISWVNGFASVDELVTFNWTTDSAWHTWIFTNSNLSSGTATNMNIFLDGVKQTLSSTTNGSGALDGDTTELRIGNRGGLDRNLNGKIALVRYWNRVLRLDEVKNITNHPFGIYAKHKSGLYLPR